jgi:hypothetical protein
MHNLAAHLLTAYALRSANLLPAWHAHGETPDTCTGLAHAAKTGWTRSC